MSNIFSRLYANDENDQITVYYDDTRILVVFESREDEPEFFTAGSMGQRDAFLLSRHENLIGQGYKQLTKDEDIGGFAEVINMIMDDKEEGKSVLDIAAEVQPKTRTYPDIPEAEATAAALVPDYSGMTRKEIMDAYYDMANHALTPLITEGLTEGLKVYKVAVKNGEAEDTNISIEMDTEYGVMLLYYGEDECAGEPFFCFSLGFVLKVCAAMLNAADANSKQSLSNWFEDAVPNLPKNVLKGLEITLWVPDVGGDPYLEL
ncbi:MAG: hypothetical protein LBU81_01255 [Methanosarcinales archaeon]|jgi:hypothetical protein|nr:hypothetical protein [Methanosarcinales archaeon]